MDLTTELIMMQEICLNLYKITPSIARKPVHPVTVTIEQDPKNCSPLREVLLGVIQHTLALPVDFLVLLGKGLLRVQWPGHHVVVGSRAHHLASDDWYDSSLVSMLSWDPLNSIESRLVSLSSRPLNRTHQRTPLTAHNKDPDPARARAGAPLVRPAATICQTVIYHCRGPGHTQTATSKPHSKLLLHVFDLPVVFDFLNIKPVYLTSRPLRWPLFKSSRSQLPNKVLVLAPTCHKHKPAWNPNCCAASSSPCCCWKNNCDLRVWSHR